VVGGAAVAHRHVVDNMRLFSDKKKEKNAVNAEQI
jgi:hypothetical protein